MVELIHDSTARAISSIKMEVKKDGAPELETSVNSRLWLYFLFYRSHVLGE